MTNPTILSLTLEDYERAAAEYCASLPLEHFMERPRHGIQRRITLDSLTELKDRCGNLDFFNELLVQYVHDNELTRVCPDNMVIRGVWPSPNVGSYNLEREPLPPFLVIEYVSPRSHRKDYEESFLKYEQHLQVPYCILFDPDRNDLRVYAYNGASYQPVQPDAQGRYAIDELDLQVGLVDNWLRFWHQGDLIELRPEMRKRLEEEIENQQEENRRQKEENRRQKEEIDNLTRELNVVVDQMRVRVERKAEAAGRDDILRQLPGAMDAKLLQQWLDELD